MTPRLATVVLVAGVGALVARAAWISGHPPGERPLGGVVLGIETVVWPGVTALRWEGPYKREATVTGEGRFEVWRAPLWTGRPAGLEAVGADIGDARIVVDHRLGLGECLGAAVAEAPILSGLGLGLLVLAIAWDGTVGHAALLALALAAIRAFSPAWVLDSDPARYWASAGAILGGRLPDPLWPPAWPAMLTPAVLLGGADPLAGRLLGVVLHASCPILAARVVATWRQGASRAPLAAALVTALSFELTGFAPSLYADTSFVVLGLAFLSTPGPVASGLLGAAAALTRAHALGVLPFVAFTRGPRFFAALLVPIALWSGGLSSATGQLTWISNNAGMNLWIGHRPGADGDWHDPGPPPAEGYGAAALGAIRADPGTAATRVVSNAGRLWNASRSDRTLATRPLPFPLLPFSALVALAALGAWTRPRRDLLVWLVATTVVTAVFFAPVRYKLGLYPALLPLAGEGLAAAGARISRLLGR